MPITKALRNIMIVAAADTPSKLKSLANYVCSGNSEIGGDENTINMALQEGEVVLLLPGTYWLSNSIILNNNQVIQGCGASTILKLIDNPNSYDIISVNGKSNVVIKCLTIDGSNKYYSCIRLTNTTNSVVESCYVYSTGLGIFLEYSNNNKIEKNICESNMEASINLEYSNNNIITENISRSCGNGIKLIESNNNLIANNILTNNNVHAIYLQISNNNIIIGNTCQENSDYSIYLEGGEFNLIANNISDKSLVGIILSMWSHSNIVIGNLCRENLAEGLYIDGSNNNTVSHNTCIGNGTEYSTSNIMIEAGSYNLIIGNKCRHNNISRYGISILSSDSVNNIVHGNDLYQSGLDGDIYDEGTNTRFRDNIGNDGNWLTDA